ncbi:Ubiquinone biosynthesis O-methyltransferase [subsurface metagenome]
MMSTRSSWDQYALQDSIVSQIGESNITRYKQKAYVDKVKAILNSHFKAGDLILDIGCGVGKWVVYLIQNNIKCIGVDSSKIAVQKANEGLIRMGIDPVVKLGNATELEFKRESFDGIIAFGLIEHFPNHKQVLSKWVSLLKFGGRIIISLPNALRIDWLVWDALWINLLKRHKLIKISLKASGFVTTFHGYEERWTPGYVNRLLQSVSLKNIKIQTLYTLLAPLYYHARITNKIPESFFNLINPPRESKMLGLYVFGIGEK